MKPPSRRTGGVAQKLGDRHDPTADPNTMKWHGPRRVNLEDLTRNVKLTVTGQTLTSIEVSCSRSRRS
jgi:hypothetical protein